MLDIIAKTVQEFDSQEMEEAESIRSFQDFMYRNALKQFKSISQTSESRFGKLTVDPMPFSG